MKNHITKLGKCLHQTYQLKVEGNPKRIIALNKSRDRYQVILDLFEKKRAAGEPDPTVTVEEVLIETYERFGYKEAEKVKGDTIWDIEHGFYNLS